MAVAQQHAIRAHPLQAAAAHYAPSYHNMAGHGPPSLAHSQSHTSSNYSINTQSSNRSSDTTQGTTASTLFSSNASTLNGAPPMPTNASFTSVNGAGPARSSDMVMPTDNIMNSVADASSSLFQICVALRQRLTGVPGFQEYLEEVEEEADEDTDPVTLLWRTFRRGYPLMLLYNALRPQQPLNAPAGFNEEKKAKAATYKFIQACIADLHIPQEELFIITDLYGDDTTGFVKVAKVVNRVLDYLVAQKKVEDVRPTASDFMEAEKGMKRTQRQHIVSELVRSERTYVQHLELLQSFKHLVEEKGVIPGDAVHDIFLNLNALLDFQRRFLIRVEQTNAQHEDEQNWGKLFLMYAEAFKVYEPYIANQKKCERTVIADFNKLKDAGGSIEMRQMVESPTALHSFLMKPFQRLTKYPLLLEQLLKKGDLDEARKEDLGHGMLAATSILTASNQAVDREEKAEAVQELKMRVEDWKGHRIEGFGELLLYGTFTVLKSENLANGKDAERQYHVYLFETILLCCKNIDINKPKNKLYAKNLTDPKGKPKLQLKGRIFMQNVTDLVSLAKPGSYTCQIFWKGDPSIENFIIRFTTEEMLKKWNRQIEHQRKRYREPTTRLRNSDGSRNGGTSVTEFTYMQNQPALENPYQEDLSEDDDDVSTLANSMTGWSDSGAYPHHSFSQSRNGSSSSLRSRSTTGESSQTAASAYSRPAPPRLPSNVLPSPAALTLRTRELQQAAMSPGERAGDSYFSPTTATTDSPMSSRTSASSGMYPFPRQVYTQNGYYEEGQGQRFTAPAMPRPPPSANSTNGHMSSNGYPATRVPSGHSRYPPGAAMHSSQQMPSQRSRSASSPDIHNGQRVAPRAGSQPPVPEMPVGYQNINRSQSNSPALANGLPPRVSPQMTRDRQHSGQQDLSPTEYAQRPGVAHYHSSRTVTPVSMNHAMSPPPPMVSSVPEGVSTATPAQLKVKVNCPLAGQSLTLVVSTTISYSQLKDRIDAKLQRSTNLTLGDRSSKGPDGQERTHVKLKYLDDDDYVSIQSDEDVQTAFETWREQKGEGIGGMGEIELFCQR
ncbi:Rho guanine nucleotide exchange factor scd1 [Fulvia fulva]|uniref:Rho guanine nucleotide exchange factor scd1 n=1 Tax=Passalora fulva TaxID=5499 RepID=A0A9Q8LIR8_PASFU|nr:Rho guanine nucleotide exchange factor scd1 [Fulvia fulva]KAK4624552.1 Rho guanine nucleotide exchange factor scd1 [Fulvia fulva]KAK4625484.1 Rho guanine nucleotide exchange factor scd1 [Fulvia fulva]UJO18162.1 Rho guanine nucleotide exchange factor scd1 [Fulvia fulva]WPV15202.1 Rho guanine nucleotide exchange factor scd1 [Fulvia fulva]WPV29951.1 Rho guanine nucleotide exchange factor scd1 [Fulvia fulva]